MRDQRDSVSENHLYRRAWKRAASKSRAGSMGMGEAGVEVERPHVPRCYEYVQSGFLRACFSS